MMGMNAECKRGVVGTKRRERLGKSSSGGGGAHIPYSPLLPGVLLPFPLLPSSLLSLTNNLNIPQNTEHEWLMTRGLMTYIGSETGQELWLVNVIIIVLFQLFLRMTDKRQNVRRIKHTMSWISQNVPSGREQLTCDYALAISLL